MFHGLGCRLTVTAGIMAAGGRIDTRPCASASCANASFYAFVRTRNPRQVEQNAERRRRSVRRLWSEWSRPDSWIAREERDQRTRHHEPTSKSLDCFIGRPGVDGDIRIYPRHLRQAVRITLVFGTCGAATATATASGRAPVWAPRVAASILYDRACPPFFWTASSLAACGTTCLSAENESRRCYASTLALDSWKQPSKQCTKGSRPGKTSCMTATEGSNERQARKPWRVYVCILERKQSNP